jgi:periplasmic protein TonB
MFADSWSDSPSLIRSRRGWATLVSFSVQALAVTCLLIVPLFYTQVLPRLGSVSRVISPPIGAPPAQAAAPQQQSSGGEHALFTNLRMNAFVIPRQIPLAIETGPDQPPPSFPYTGTGAGPGSATIPDGILGSSGTAVPPIPKRSETAHPPRISLMMEGSLIRRVEPQYPVIAKNMGVQGTVVLAAVISREGTIEQLQVVSGHPLLVQAALRAVREWRYRPYILNDAPVEVDTQITVNFILHK